MRQYSYFASERREEWPRLEELERYFLAPPGQRWFFETGNDGASFAGYGVEGTEHLQHLEDFEPHKDRIDVELELTGHPDIGVFLMYSKWGGGYEDTFSSRGDMSRLREWVRTLHEDLRPVGLYIPYEAAWKAVKEFIETDGALPKSIEWIANKDLPPNTFPAPHDAPEGAIVDGKVFQRRPWEFVPRRR
jgi:hypothetical protein